MKLTGLGIDLIRERLVYDHTTGLLFWKVRPVETFLTKNAAGTWNTRFAGKEAFRSTNHLGYKQGAINHVKLLAHVVCWSHFYGEYPNHPLDHIDGIRSNNTIRNLRESPDYANNRNMAKNKLNRSGFAGVSWHKWSKQWRAQISINGVKKDLGYFKNIEEAVKERRKWEIELGYSETHGIRESVYAPTVSK